MTLMEALKSTIEFGYSNDNLFNKVLTDHGLTSTTTYTQAHRDDIDLCLVDVLMYLADHPEVKDGQSSIKFDPAHLRASAKKILARYPDASTATLLAAGFGGTVKAKTIW